MPDVIQKKQSTEMPEKEIINDLKTILLSRYCSIIAKMEVLTGKAKFGIFGDGKELAQVALAKNFRPGDWRSGYYRDQTFMFASGICTPEEFFAQVYGDTGLDHNPGNGGRSFNNHFCTRTLLPDGSWKELSKMKNSAADLSPTAGQMPRLTGLAYASKLFRNNKELSSYTQFSHNGDEVAFGMIGDASTAEGHFFETMNSAAVLQIPLAMTVYDDGYGISVPKNLQIVKSSISDALKGFEKEVDRDGILIYKAKGWDYREMVQVFKEGITICREKHIPVLFHIEEMTQPLGHSTSGSHERYKSRERLEFEVEFDPITKMKEWMVEQNIISEKDMKLLEEEAENIAKMAKETAWKDYTNPLEKERDELLKIIENRSCKCKNDKLNEVAPYSTELKRIINPIRKDNISAARKILRTICLECSGSLNKEISHWLAVESEKNYNRYSSTLYNESSRSTLKVKPILPQFSESSLFINGREIIKQNFDHLFEKYPLLVTFGEDTGKIGDVNKGLEGLQEKYGELRVTDTGVREATIIGQGIGMALRGLRPVAEIQYLDYLLYGLQTLSDDLATLHWRTKAGQAAPLIIRTRGHRLEGIWHSGSPMSVVINALRGIYVCVPRDMTRAAGFYNTLLEGDDPGLVIEPLNGYRLKERRPDNIGEYKIPLGIPEILMEGKDITLVTYGSCVRIAQTAVGHLKDYGISVELIDVQTLLPFDLNNTIAESIKKTNRVIFLDEDVPGGATAFMMKKVIEDQNCFHHLDSQPRTLTAKEHRPAYATDGDYFSNPNAEDVFDAVYEILHESNPRKYPEF